MSESPTTVINSLTTLDEFLSKRNHSEDEVYISGIPDLCKEYPCMLGVDEAGRGPVLGPMVYGIAFCPINEATLLDRLGCADSKALTEKIREKIFEDMCKNSNKIGWAVDVISPNSISNSMLGRTKTSLNQVSMNSAIGLIKLALKNEVNVNHIFVDTVGPPEKYQAYLRSIFPKIKVTVSKKADSLYSVVSAASICAKVTRDHALQVWNFAEGLQLKQDKFGSGYPGDPTTKKFMADNCDVVFGFPQLVRTSWSTANVILETNAYHTEWDDDDEENNPKVAPSKSIASFFKVMSPRKDGTVGPETGKMRHEFFTTRFLERTIDL